MLTNAGRFRDRNPETVPAGKLFGQGETAKECIKTPEKPRTPEQVHKFRCTTQPAPGKTRIFYGRYSDPDISSLLCHGIATRPSYVAGQLVSPQPKSYFEYRLMQKREDGVYASRKRAPLGRSHDQRPGLPKGTEPNDQVYGLPTLKDCAAGELINPSKTRQQVAHESLQGSDLYKKSHSAYTVGETYNRKYNWCRVPATSCFGVETPHDNRGLNTKKTLKWLHETLSEKAAPVSSKRVDLFRERNTPQVGVVHDPIKDTMLVDKDHTFGIMVKPDECGAGDLIHMRNNASFLRGRERARGVLAAVRQHLKKANYHNFNDLKAAFTFYDKDKSGKIDINELREICKQFNLPVQQELLEMLLEYCDMDGDKQIDYVEFANFLNWKDKMPSGFQKRFNNNTEEEDRYEAKILREAKQSGMIPDEPSTEGLAVLSKQVDKSASDYATSASLINGNVLNNYTKDLRPYGIPTIRSDLPAPRIRRIGNNTNYGDESDSYGLINPSIYSNYGVYEEDFFKSRDPCDMKRILDSIGVEMTNEVFQDLWKEVRTGSPGGQVSVETFRNVLDEKVAEEYEKANNNNETESNNLGDIIQNMLSNKPNIYNKFHTDKFVKSPTRQEVLTS